MEFNEIEILQSRLKNQVISAFHLSDDVICENTVPSAMIKGVVVSNI